MSVAIVIGCLVIFATYKMRTDHVEISVSFPQVGGIKVGTSVIYGGTRVGTVEEIELSRSGSFLVLLAISNDFGIARSNIPTIITQTDRLGGNATIEFMEASGEVLFQIYGSDSILVQGFYEDGEFVPYGVIKTRVLSNNSDDDSRQ